MLNKNTWGTKRCEANQKQHIANMQACATKNSDISWEQEVTLPILFSILWITYKFIDFHKYIWLALSLGHLYNNFGTKRWPSDKANHMYLWKYAINYCLDVIQGVENSFGKVTFGLDWYQSFWLHMPACLQCCFWLALHLFMSHVFLFNISLFVSKHNYFVKAYKQMLLWSLILKNSSLQFFLTFSTEWYINTDYVSKSLSDGNHIKGVQVMATINLQCNSLSQIHFSVFYRLKIVWQIGHTLKKCWYKFGWNPLRNEWVIGQTSECTKRGFEKILPGFMKVPASPQKVCNKNEQRKNNMCVKCYWWKESVYRARVENSCHGYQWASSW